MGELRYNPVTKKWALISPERGTHRNSYVTKDAITSMPCPFCDKDGGINKNYAVFLQLICRKVLPQL